MTTLREAAQQALEALEYLNVTAEHRVDDRIPDAAISAPRAALVHPVHECAPGRGPGELLHHSGGVGPGHPVHECAPGRGPRLEAALEQPEQEPFRLQCVHCGTVYAEGVPPAVPEQEPVAWMFQHEETGRLNYVSNDGYDAPGRFLEMNPRYALVCALYTHPPRREWQSLSEEEIWKLYYDERVPEGERCDRVDFARAIEAALKERNA